MQEGPDTQYSDEEDNIFKDLSMNKNPVDFKHLMQTKGKINLVFSAELTEEFAARTEKLKKAYVKDNLEKVEQLKGSIDQKRIIIYQAVECLQHVQFEPDRGLVLDQLSSYMEDSQLTDRSALMLDKVYKTSSKGNKEEMKRLKARNKKEIEQFEKDNAAATNTGSNQRMCGCEAFCSIF